MFECKEQEVHDLNTGATLVFGRHAGFEGQGTSWVRVAVRNGDPPYTKTTTIVFDSSGSVLSMTGHKPDVVYEAPPADHSHDFKGSDGGPLLLRKGSGKK